MQLTEYEQRLLAGDEGRLKQVAMENTVRYAKIVGAEELCPVTKATVFCGAHNYLNVCQSKDPHKVFSQMQLAKLEEVIPFDCTCDECYTQSCVSVSDQFEYQPLGQSQEVFELNQKYLEIANQAGVVIAGSCAPYLTGWLPVQGEHYVTTESGVTMIGNSIWGACCNSDGIEAAFWSAICGRTPLAGLHVKANRAGTHVYRVEAEINSMTDWNLLGKAVGRKLPANGNPVVVGDFKNVNFNKLRQFLTVLAISSNSQMCHIVGYTPEARSVEDACQGQKPQAEYVITRQDLTEAYEMVCQPGSGPVDMVTLGCPHYDMHQIKMVADYLKGKKVHPGVDLMLWTVYPIRHMAEVNGYLKIIEEAGGKIYTGTCPGTIGKGFLGKYQHFVADSFKKGFSIKNMMDAEVYFGDTYRCLDAAVTGQWKEEYRWQK